MKAIGTGLPLITGVALFAVVARGLFAQPDAAQPEGRWYSEPQVKRGAALFAEHCAECHGTRAQGLAEDWRQLGPDGHYPPPPLDGTAHAWHHPLPQLRRTVREGGIRLGGTMPPFVDKLGAEEIDATIAWVQSLWPDATYAAWQERGGSFKAWRRDAATASSE